MNRSTDGVSSSSTTATSILWVRLVRWIAAVISDKRDLMRSTTENNIRTRMSACRLRAEYGIATPGNIDVRDGTAGLRVTGTLLYVGRSNMTRFGSGGAIGSSRAN